MELKETITNTLYHSNLVSGHIVEVGLSLRVIKAQEGATFAVESLLIHAAVVEEQLKHMLRGLERSRTSEPTIMGATAMR
jgi:hypothetical protein